MGYYFWDDGTHGDLVAGDGNYGAENVRTQLTENPNPGHRYMIRFSACTEHRVTAMDVEPFYIRNTPVGIEEQQQPTSPSVYKLEQNFPNPVNSNTVISYQLPVNSRVELSIYNLLGQKILALVSEKQSAGIHKLNWDARGLASGVYLYRLEAGDPSTSSAQGFVQVKKLILMR